MANDRFEMKFPVNVNGFNTKTINIRTVAGGTKFLLQQVNQLGLPDDAVIMAIWTRTQTDTITSTSNLKLVSTAVYNNAYLSLKDRANCDNTLDLLSSQYYVPSFTDSAMWVQPVISKLIDWNQSYIQINPRVTAVDDRVFELIILYTNYVDNTKIDPRVIFRDGSLIAGTRVAQYEIPLNVTQRLYPIVNTNNIGLDRDAIVLGFDLKQNAFPLFGNSSIAAATINSSYLTLKQGTCAFIDQFPVAFTDYNRLIDQLHYFPIVPTEVGAIDWQQSYLEVKDGAAIVAGQVFQYSIIWYNTKANRKDI